MPAPGTFPENQFICGEHEQTPRTLGMKWQIWVGIRLRRTRFRMASSRDLRGYQPQGDQNQLFQDIAAIHLPPQPPPPVKGQNQIQ